MRAWFTCLSVTALVACSGAGLNAGKNGTKAKTSSETGKPSEDTEGVPGYLVDPELVKVSVDGDDIKITGGKGAVETPQDAAAVISAFVTDAASLAAAQTDANAKVEGLFKVSTAVADDGTFTITLSAKAGDLIIVTAASKETTTVTLPESAAKTTAVVTIFDGSGGKFIVLEKSPTTAKPDETDDEPADNDPKDPVETDKKTCAGKPLGDACWYLAPDSITSCSVVCKSHGGYDEATRTYAGDSGTTDQCFAVLDALGATGVDQIDVPGAIGLGCTSTGTSRFRWTSTPTSADAILGGFQRACACLE